MFQSIPSYKGFTLVEIMIVIAIIGILSAALFPSLTQYLANSRDASRMLALSNLKKAILNSYAENGTYPTPESGCVPSILSPRYIPTIPMSPSGSTYDEGCGPNGKYGYGVSTNFSTPAYVLISNMEGEIRGNYTGSTNGMIGVLTASGYDAAVNATQKGIGNTYIVFDGSSPRVVVESSTSTSSDVSSSTEVPSLIPENGECSSSGCNIGTVNGLSGPVCGGTKTWTCTGINNGSPSGTCSATSPVCLTYTITWGANGGILTSPSTTTITQPNTLGILPSDPTRSGYSFSGWYTAPNGGELVTTSTVPTGNMTYSAQWKTPLYASCTAAGQYYTVTGSKMPAYILSAGGGSWSIPACDTDDRIICTGTHTGYTWAMCNVGSATAGTSSIHAGYMFQWGRNVPFPISGTITKTPGPLSISFANTTTDFITNTDGNTNFEWTYPLDIDLWGTGIDSNIVTYATATPASRIKMQGPCAPGYHVPTYMEIAMTVGNISGSEWYSVMQAPLSGYYDNNGNLNYQNSWGWWMVAGVSYEYGAVRTRNVGWTNGGVLALNRSVAWSTYSQPVRCIRNF